MENGHTTGDEREVWMERVNFDGQVTGETARSLIRAAKAAGVDVHALLGNVLAKALADRLSPNLVKESDVKVEPMTINAGNGGFHVLTFVTDGYGNLVAENSAGDELAREAWESSEDPDAPQDEFRRLAEAAFAKQAAQTTD